jgi:ribosome-associated translation inhibitor RaiA
MTTIMSFSIVELFSTLQTARRANVQVHMQGSDRALARAMRTYLERRLRWTLGRYAGQVTQVTVRLLEGDEVNGGTGSGCRISAELLPAGRLIQHEAGDGCLFSAIDAVVERMGRSVRRQVEQEAERPVRR